LCNRELAMKKIASVILILIAGLCRLLADDLVSGLEAYARSDWKNAVEHLRRAVSRPEPATAEAWYWLVMSEISLGDHSGALRNADRFLTAFPADGRAADIQYQKGRVLFLEGYYERSILALYIFVSRWPRHALVSSAYYWIGESLFAVGRFEEAAGLFYRVVTLYTGSVKHEAAVYRLSLIERTAREEELLSLLKLSHEESLRVIEEYQRRERTYEQAINALQKRIADTIKDSRLGELEAQILEEQNRNARLQDDNAVLEMHIAELVAALALAGQQVPSQDLLLSTSDITADDRRRRLEEIRNKARSLQSLYDQILENEGR